MSENGWIYTEGWELRKEGKGLARDESNAVRPSARLGNSGRDPELTITGRCWPL